MASNLWENADFEAGVSGWSGTVVQSSTQAWEQTYSMRWTPGSNTYDGTVGPTRELLEQSTQYTLSAYIYPTDTAAMSIRAYGDTLTLATGGATCTGGEWTRISVTFTTAADHADFNFKIFKNGAATENYIYIDAIMVEAGASASAWENYSTGVDVSATSGTLTIAGYNPTVQTGTNTNIDATLGTLAIAGYNPTVQADVDTNIDVVGGSGGGDGLWDIGAYIYDSGSGGVVIVGYNPTIQTNLITGIDATLGTLTITGYNPTVTVISDLLINDMAHGQAIDAPAMTADLSLSVAEMSHNVALEAPAMALVGALSIDELAHAQSLDAPAMTSGLVLAIADASHAQTIVPWYGGLWDVDDSFSVPVSSPSDDITFFQINPTSYTRFVFTYQTGGEVNIYFRYANVHNYFRFTATAAGGWELVKVIGGSPTSLGSGGSGMFVNGAEANLSFNVIEGTGYIQIRNGEPPIVTVEDEFDLAGVSGGGVNNQLSSNDVDVTKYVYYVEGTEIELTATRNFSAAALAHSQAFDAPAMTALLELVPADLAHGQSLEAPAMALVGALSIDELAHAQSLDAPAMTALLQLVPGDIAHAQSFDAPAMTALLELVPADLAHAQLFDSPTIAGDTDLVIADLTHSQAFDAPAMTATLVLVTADIAHGLGFDVCDVDLATVTLAIADMAHGQAIDAPAVAVLGQLAVADLAHAISLDACDVDTAAGINLVISSLTHSQAFDAPAMTYLGVLSVEDMAHLLQITKPRVKIVGEVSGAGNIIGVLISRRRRLRRS